MYQRAFDEFEEATDYYCLGAAGVIRGCLWGHGGVERDAKKAADVAKEVLERLDDRLSRDYYLGYNLYMLRIIALRYAEDGEAALTFAKSQDDPEVESPLRDVEPFQLGDPEELLKAAGEGNRDRRINVYLATGQLAEALIEATEQMRLSAGSAPRYLAAALRNLARCFKAHDLNLIRANRFLEYHRTGEGTNPLPELEAELAATAAP